jgi:hypothetical protein
MPIPTWTLPNSAALQSRTLRNALAPLVIGPGLAGIAGGIARAADAYLPIVMPITGFLSVEGGSQRNGAVMALEQAPGGLKVDFPIFDTGTSATGAATGLDKALSSQKATAAAVTVFGTEMVAMMPIAAEYKVPLLTISGLAKITESSNPYIFRFLPNDREIKVAHARRAEHPDRQQLLDRRAHRNGAVRAGRTHRRLRGNAVGTRSTNHPRHQGLGGRLSEALRHRARRTCARTV